ncbi:MAG: hypothetical protein IPJ20_23540 [Flammeovirgaceae bacterium]|nr:hypothetical protein [Flammeovirgaceae bacterium]
MLGQTSQLTGSAAMQNKMKELAKEQLLNVAKITVSRQTRGFASGDG